MPLGPVAQTPVAVAGVEFQPRWVESGPEMLEGKDEYSELENIHTSLGLT